MTRTVTPQLKSTWPDVELIMGQCWQSRTNIKSIWLVGQLLSSLTSDVDGKIELVQDRHYRMLGAYEVNNAQ